MKKIIIGILLVLILAIYGCSEASSPTVKTTDLDSTNTAQAVDDEATTELQLTGETKTFEITAKQWEFLPSVLEVNLGDKVVLKITSIDVSHGIMLPAFNVNEMLEPGKDVIIEFIADQTGEYSFFCNVFCGSGHGSMQGTLIVT